MKAEINRGADPLVNLLLTFGRYTGYRTAGKTCRSFGGIRASAKTFTFQS